MLRSEKFAAIRDIADAIGTKTATPEQEAQLTVLLKGNIEAQRFFYDYMGMHIHLLAPAASNFEFTYKRKTETAVTEEFTVRRKDTAQTISNIDNNEEITQARLKNSSENRHEHGKKIPLIVKYKLWLILTAAVLLLLLLWQQFNQSSAPIIAKIEKGQLSIVDHGMIDGHHLFSGVYQTVQESSLLLVDGTTLHLAAHSHIKFFNNHEMRLTKGKLSVTPAAASDNNIIVHVPNFTLNSNGDKFSMDLTQGKPVINSGENTLLIPKRWQPKHFWSFDSQSDRAIDSVGSASGIPAAGATRTTGLLGQGAFVFDNTANARIDVGSGGGTAPATGTFSSNDGITIEALIRPKYSGEPGEIDEIFRKGERGFGNELLILFSFQNDINNIKDYLMPDGKFAESLSFGLFVFGHGYQELKLPLDGLNGRPTLAELKAGSFHHVVATYDVRTGLKAIYIDGQQLATYQYPPGSKFLSGGSGEAAIGNNPVYTRWDREAFSGIIDEVAFYDFSLPPLTLQHHFKNTQQGQNYFGFPPSAKTLPKRMKLILPAYSSVELDPLTGLPYQILKQ